MLDVRVVVCKSMKRCERVTMCKSMNECEMCGCVNIYECNLCNGWTYASAWVSVQKGICVNAVDMCMHGNV